MPQQQGGRSLRACSQTFFGIGSATVCEMAGRRPIPGRFITKEDPSGYFRKPCGQSESRHASPRTRAQVSAQARGAQPHPLPHGRANLSRFRGDEATSCVSFSVRLVCVVHTRPLGQILPSGSPRAISIQRTHPLPCTSAASIHKRLHTSVNLSRQCGHKQQGQVGPAEVIPPHRTVHFHGCTSS